MEKILTPKIRFRGFSEPWKELSIMESCDFSSGYGYTKNDLLPNGNPIILYGRLYTKYETEINTIDTFVKKNSNSVISTGGEVIMPSSGETAEDIAVASVVSRSGIILGGGLHILRPKEPLTSFHLAVNITHGVLHNQLAKLAQGKSVVHLYKDNVANQQLATPSKEEQEYIRNLFVNLDSALKSKCEELEKLENVKKACMERMFPCKGETTPQLRFKGFTDEWKEVRFSKIYQRSIIKNDLSFGTDKIISVAHMYYAPKSYVKDIDYMKSYNVMKLGDIAFEGNRSKNFAHGRFVENTIGDGIVSHVFVVFTRIDKDYDLYFWKYLINYEPIMGPKLVNCTKSSTMMTDLVAEDFLKESILIPSLAEQKKIGEYFCNLDELIAAKRQEIEKLQNIKQSLLDKMFV